MKSLSSFDRILFIFFMFIGLLIAFRIWYTGSIMHLFLCWNIFLAWIPYVLSKYFAEVKHKAIWKQCFLFMSWLLFFPNALYIVTDIIHIEDNTDIPIWYDAVLLFGSSFIGIAMAFIALKKVENYLEQLFQKRVVAVLIPAILFASSFGVYLGRFQRWNSWDVLKDPMALGLDIAGNFISPIENYKTWAITILFTGIYTMLYFFSKNLPQAFTTELQQKEK